MSLIFYLTGEKICWKCASNGERESC